MPRIQTFLRKGVAEKFEEYRKRNNNMPVYRASAYLIELGLKVLEENRSVFSQTSQAFDCQFCTIGGRLWCGLKPGLLARLDIYALKRRIPQYQAVQEIVEIGLKAVEPAKVLVHET